MKTCPKIKKQHLDPKGYDKMRVKHATQIFSHSVAASMRAAINIGKLDHPHAQLTVDFIKQVDMVFDILNSSTDE